MFGKLFGKSQTHKVNHKFWKWVQNNCSCVEFKPEKIKAWSELKKLELRSNDLSDLSDDISILTGLVDLSLSGNKFSIVPEIVFSLNELMFLNFGVNQISELPNGIGRLKKLKILDLGENKLISLPSEIGELKNLETLILNNNMLTSLPKEIGNMTALNQIYIWDNNLSSLPDEIMNLNNLESIDLQNNNFTNEDSKNGRTGLVTPNVEYRLVIKKCNISDPIYAEKNIDGGSVEDSFSAIYLDSQYRDTVSAIFKWSNLDEDDFFSAMIANDRYNKIIVNEGLNAFDSENNIVPIYMALNAETPSTEDELIQWVKIAYIQICDEYNLEPNSKLKIITVGTSGNKKTITMMEY